MAARRHPSPAPLVLADAHRVRVTADALVANRRLARPHAPGVALLELGARGEIIGGAPGDLLLERELLLLATGRERAPALRRMLFEPPGPECPASLLRVHPELTVLCGGTCALPITSPPGGATGWTSTSRSTSTAPGRGCWPMNCGACPGRRASAGGNSPR